MKDTLYAQYLTRTFVSFFFGMLEKQRALQGDSVSLPSLNLMHMTPEVTVSRYPLACVKSDRNRFAHLTRSRCDDVTAVEEEERIKGSSSSSATGSSEAGQLYKTG